MNGGLIPSRYAKALYKFALEHGTTGKVYEEMQHVVQAFETNAELSATLSNPYVSAPDKGKLLLIAAGRDASDDFKGFVRLIIDNKRESYAYEMALAYRDLYRKANGISIVKITSAIQLPEDELRKLRKLIENSFPGRTLEFSERVDSSIIGGFIVDVDHVRMDASISNEIEKLRLKLLSTK